MDALRILFRGLWLACWLCFHALRWLFRGLALLAPRIFKRTRTTFGSARWAGLRQLITGKAWGGDTGLIVGKLWGRFLRFKGEGALLVYAPQGSGKGVGIVVPNLLDHPGSVIVTDVKGENAAVTARYRATLGPVYQLNAIDPAGTACFNPLTMIRVGSFHEAEDAAAIADMLVTEESHEGHWDTSAKNVIALFINYVMHAMPREQRTLSTVRELVSSDEEHLKEMLERMTRLPIPTIAEEARQLLAGVEAQTDESISVFKNVNKAMAIWSKDRVCGRLTAASDFDMMDLHHGVISIYVMVPEEFTTVFAPFLRVMMGCAITALVRAKSLPKPEHLPLLLIDECAALGRLDALQKGIGYLRSYSRMILVFQDLGQVFGLYGQHFGQSFLAASGAQVAFRVSDNVTARELADSIGQRTVETRSSGYSQANTEMFRMQQQAGLGEAGYYLIDPAQIRNLPDTLAIIRMSTVRAPILARKVQHFTEQRWEGQWDVWRAPVLPSAVVPFPGPWTSRSGRDAA